MNSSKQIHQIDPNLPVWQRNYYKRSLKGNLSSKLSRFPYEHIIRNGIELEKIREYIELNPSMWEKDEDNLENLYF